MTKLEKLVALLDDMSDGDLIAVWNEYCDNYGRYDDRVEDMALLPDFFSVDNGDDLFNLLNRFYFGHDENDEKSSANPNRDYFYFDGYGSIISTDYPKDQIDLDKLAEYIIDHDNDLYNDDIRELLDDEDDESGDNEND